MTREDIRKIVDGITDEQLGKILDINSKDIGRAKGKSDELEKEIQRLSDDIKTKDETISNLKENLGNNKKLQEKIDEYERAESKRKEEEKKANEEKDFANRFDALEGEKKFINELTKKGIYEEFKEAILKEENKGKGDREVFETLIKDRANIFENPNKPADIAGLGKGESEVDIKPTVPRFF